MNRTENCSIRFLTICLGPSSHLGLASTISVAVALVEHSTTRWKCIAFWIEQTVVGTSCWFSVIGAVPCPAFNISISIQPFDAASAEILALILACLACHALTHLLCAGRRLGVARARRLLNPDGHVVDIGRPVHLIGAANRRFHLWNSCCLEDTSADFVVVLPVRLSAFIVVHWEGFDKSNIARGLLVITQIPAASEESGQIRHFLLMSSSCGRN